MQRYREEQSRADTIFVPLKPLISFCIATFNRGQVVIDCLQRVLQNGLPASAFEILIVDNASTDNTAALIQQQCPTVRVLRSPENGGPVAKNLAIREAVGAYIVLLDDDAYPAPGSTARMIQHFEDNPRLGAAVFDVTLPDGSKEGSAYPDVFIGAGTGLRRAALESLPGGLASGPLPAHFFMQAEEYDLSFRLLDAGWSVQRFWDMPLTHLKSPGARIGQRTTGFDVRNNLYLLASYVPAPLCHELAADWLARYWRMALQRDHTQPPHPVYGTHKQAYLRGAAEGLGKWTHNRGGDAHLLADRTIERIFKFQAIQERLGRALERTNAHRVVFADLSKNLLAYHKAARSLGVEVVAVADDALADEDLDYRGIPLYPWSKAATLLASDTLVVLTNLSRVHAPARAAALRRTLGVPVEDLFSPVHACVTTHGLPRNPLNAKSAATGELSS